MIYLLITNIITLGTGLFLFKKYLDYRNSRRTFQRLIEHINVGYYRYRVRDGVVLDVNAGFINIFDLKAKRAEIIGRSLSELLVYVDGEGSIREQLKAKGELRNHEYHFKTISGKDKCVLHNSYILKDPYTDDDVIEALIEDITEERLSYDRMKESQERYEKLFKFSGDMVIISRLEDFTIEEINPVTEVVTGYSSADLIGRSFVSIFHPARRDMFKEIKDDLIFQGTSRMETVMVCRDGAYKEVIMTLSVVEIRDNRIIMAVGKDISDLVKGREEEKKRQEELECFWKASMEREERIKDLKEEISILRDNNEA
ncbi:MAG: PAS domain-containing protein [Candidatus Omnitrophica bacterium]|nr:PAS domain-containing protein [Candidatus Omnitrophota bacterium]MDD5488255.1 PAS domain-containing protein [Candidatus Omnitrophota bacterium]